MAEDDGLDDINVFSDDDKLKILGELLGNKSSRDIIRLLICKERYMNDIATTLNIRPNLVVYHLKKMESIGLVETRERRITRKGQEHRFFRIRPGILVLPEPEEGDGLLKRLAGRAPPPYRHTFWPTRCGRGRASSRRRSPPTRWFTRLPWLSRDWPSCIMKKRLVEIPGQARDLI